jgi:hypothetical protein
MIDGWINPTSQTKKIMSESGTVQLLVVPVVNSGQKPSNHCSAKTVRKIHTTEQQQFK